MIKIHEHYPVLYVGTHKPKDVLKSTESASMVVLRSSLKQQSITKMKFSHELQIDLGMISVISVNRPEEEKPVITNINIALDMLFCLCQNILIDRIRPQ